MRKGAGVWMRLTVLCMMGTALAGVVGQIWAGQADEPIVQGSIQVQPAALPVTAYVDVPDENEETDTSIMVEVEPDPEALEAIQAKGDGPQVMIYHTHSHEAYEKGKKEYKEVSRWRTADQDYNVVRVGSYLAELLEARGTEVLHDTTDHEPPKLGTAYIRSLETLEAAAEKYESLKVFIDLHRDAYSKGQVQSVEIDGKKVAPLMIVIGTGEGTAGNGFSIKPQWEKNYQLAEKITEGLAQIHPELVRPIRVKTGRYNQHISTGCILVEAGYNTNTLEEVLNAMPYLAQVLSDVME